MSDLAHEAWVDLGAAVGGDVLLIADHAAARVPDDIDLGIAPELLSQHIALDIGVAEVATKLVELGAVDRAILGGVSRLVVDFNRDPGAPGIIPIASDGHAIPGNAIDHEAHVARLERFYHPYHAHIAQCIAAHRPQVIVSLHSFTPRLATKPDEIRPWHVGILYNADDRLARIAIPAFHRLGLMVGDQLPYSGKVLNYSMNRHAETNAIPYLGIEMRQDLVIDGGGQAAMAHIIGRVIAECRQNLAESDGVGQ